MENHVSAKRKPFTKAQMMITAAVASLSFCVLLYLVLSVSVSGVISAFPTYSEDTVMLLLSLPSITALLSILAQPLLLKAMSHKAASLLSLLFLLLGGILCLAFRTSMPVLIAASCLMGLAYGGLSTIYPLLVSRYFDAEGSAFVFGLCTCTMQLGSLLSKLIGGYLATQHWSYVYLTYFFVIIALIIVCLCLPREKARREETKAAASLPALKSARVWRFFGIVFLFPIFYFAISTHLSVYIEGGGLGTASLTGALSALGAAVAAAMALLFSRTLKWTRGRCFEVSFLLVGLGYLFAGLFPSKAGAVVASVAGSAGVSVFSPYLLYYINTSFKKEDATIITAFALTALNLAYSLSAYVNHFFSLLLFDGSSASVFLFAGLAATLVSLLLCFAKAKKPAQ